MTGEPGPTEDGPTVPVAAIPQPALAYALEGGEPTILGTNTGFERALGPVAAGTALREWLDGRLAGDATAPSVCASLADGEAVDARIHGPGGAAAGAFRLRATGTADTDGGVLTLAAASTDEGAPVGADRIATVVSHDLRNPLDVAKANLRAARERGDDEYFEQVADAHDRMERIVQDVLTLARGEATITPATPVDLASVAEDAWTTVDTGAATLSVDPDLPTVEADPDRLRRLFENLFRNAVEHGSTSGRTESDGSADDAPTVTVGPLANGAFYVADDGPGIPSENRELVFEAGYSVDGGTGLGLTIVERIADGHGWTVSATDGTAGGARFEFREAAPESAAETGE